MRAFAELVRAPAGLTVLGDTVAGAAASGRPLSGRRWWLPLSSVALYWSGMALNDWADRDLDAAERPERPIPSGRIGPRAALTTAVVLSAAGLGIAAAAGGRDALGVAVPLAAAIWSYDTLLKSTAAGPFGMAACRALDVLLGAGGTRAGVALPAAVVMAGHTLGVTALSLGEVHGTSSRTAKAVLVGTALTAFTSVIGPAPTRPHRLVSLAAGAGYAATVGRAQLAAVRAPGAATVRAATKTGIHGMVLLQSALTARGGSLLGAVAVAAALPLARRLGRKVSPT
ncbi:4-hydroxybenzoate polyprenyltransferase [Saccharothrix sp. ALI-22-I]|uniref:SCO3242 family prenyltransferase n=1 Tax=Saccharothrix sp. ALI-22-I TaxID=1933778 RepID=UPI00097BF398|nr:UbiA family prenyltransferase [Saccharothrix sp. ALI-22-I]ONI81936.1 4-hydroxybenzoate polyprenyltransferase [Saccharothrix sp. ALI-22-I]